MHYQPITERIIQPHAISSSKPLKILWASRIAEQKLPSVLAEIGKNIDEKLATIDVYGYFYDALPKNMFKNIKTISYRGQFNGLDSIKTEDYDLFLYTSIIDGVPNIILEAIAKGLPVIASNSGGINEVIKDKTTGLLVEDVISPNGYVEAIKDIKNNPVAAKDRAMKAQELLLKQHSWEHFVSEVERDIIDMIE